MPRGGARTEQTDDPLQPGGHAVPQQLSSGDGTAGDPVELNDPARSAEGQMTVVRVIAPPESDESSLDRRHFHQHVLDIVRGAKQAETTPRRLPFRVHVN